MQEDLITFDFEWLGMPKGEFKMLIMIADIGENLGNASDMCRYFNRSPQSKNKSPLRKALQGLAEQNIIELKRNKNNYAAIIQKTILQENKIEIKRKYVTEILKHNYTQKVAEVTVLKVYIWLLNNGKSLFTNRQISVCIGVSESTITEAKNALKEMGAFDIEKVTIKEGEQFYRCVGQIANASAFWNNV